MLAGSKRKYVVSLPLLPLRGSSLLCMSPLKWDVFMRDALHIHRLQLVGDPFVMGCSISTPNERSVEKRNAPQIEPEDDDEKWQRPSRFQILHPNLHLFPCLPL